jgi:ABC-type multidrug transport system fused ATPase/permease subunit
MADEIEEVSFRRLVRGLWVHLRRRRRWQMVAVTALMVASAFAEVMTLGTVVPFIAVLVEPERAMAFGPVARVAGWFGITSASQLVAPLAGAFVVAAVSAVALRLTVLWATTRLAMAAGAELASKAFERTLYQPYEVHVQRHSSEVTSAVVQKVEVVVYGLFFPLQNAVGSVFTLVSVAAALVAIDRQIAISSVVIVGGAYLVITRSLKGRLSRNGRQIAVAQVGVLKVLNESMGGIRELLLNGTQRVFVEQFTTSDGRRRRAQASNTVIQQAPRLLMEGIAMVLIVVLVLVLDGRQGGVVANLPELTAFAVAGQRMLPISQQCYTTVATLLASRPVLSEALAILDQTESPVERHERGEPVPFTSALTCSGLSFRYSEEKPLVLDGIDLDVPIGSTVGLVGGTGSGKSTLLDLMMGLLQPSSGTLTVDGVPLGDETIGDWRQSVAHVSQDVFLMDASIAENIAFGVPTNLIDHQRVRASAQRAQIDDFVMAEPEGYLALVGERGVRLSGGQQQRIGIARALYKGASVLIFDEATSALDSVTEGLVLKGIADSGEGVTVVMVTHRLSTLRSCDRIFELQDGRIVASGRFEDLIESSGSFREMARTWEETR